jgi:hypothetical protein
LGKATSELQIHFGFIDIGGDGSPLAKAESDSQIEDLLYYQSISTEVVRVAGE